MRVFCQSSPLAGFIYRACRSCPEDIPSKTAPYKKAVELLLILVASLGAGIVNNSLLLRKYAMVLDLGRKTDNLSIGEGILISYHVRKLTIRLSIIDDRQAYSSFFKLINGAPHACSHRYGNV
ncbi:hypothetical protein BT96DRAFT_707905 [Gymnopus androsaceus JB14]|uniref:Uncharacterized protein n=1 Tax=Gymnopus androsaceus JB14 TaxID=1447944 RepID=A0A6A4HQ19_9AGAR|nr:hypothetical protein BT96DRAFT_707905 [Gymnopus androsaceus JB14]